MKVGLIVPGGVDRTGTERVIPSLLWLIERIARVHELHVFALRQEPRPSRYTLLGAQVHNIGARPRRLRAVLALRAEHRRRPLDMLHAVWAHPSGIVAAAARRLLGCPLLLHLTGGDLAAIPEIGYGLCLTRRGRWWLRKAVTAASLVTVPSTAAAERARALGIAAQRLPFGVALDRWPVAAPRAREPDRPARLMHVASLNLVKDQRTLLLGTRVLRDSGVSFHLDIVGYDTLNGAMQRLAAELSLAACVTFHGFLPHAQLRPIMERAHLLLVSSRHEADPIVALEAAVAGVPTVGTRVGHLADWAPEAAVTVAVGDHRALATAVVELLADDARRLRIAEAAQARAVREDADSTTRWVLELYERLAGRGVGQQRGTANAAHPAAGTAAGTAGGGLGNRRR